MLYVAFVHRDDRPGFGISFPDFPGCVSDGDTIDETIGRGATALAFHIDGMIQDGEEIPEPRSLQDVRLMIALQNGGTEPLSVSSPWSWTKNHLHPSLETCNRRSER